MRSSIRIVLLLGLSSLAFAAPDKTTDDKASYLQKANKEVQDWTTKIKALQDRSEKSGMKTRQELDQHLKSLHKNLAVARKNLEELSRSSENAWKNLREGLDNALGEVTHHYQKAVSTLDKDKTKEKS